METYDTEEVERHERERVEQARLAGEARLGELLQACLIRQTDESLKYKSKRLDLVNNLRNMPAKNSLFGLNSKHMTKEIGELPMFRK